MATETARQGLLDTNILILRRWIDGDALPAESAISAVTLAELSAGPHLAAKAGDLAELARRLDALQRAENEFDPIPFGAEAARVFGQASAAVLSIDRKPRARVADLMIASTAAAEGLPLYSCNPDNFRGLEDLLAVVPVPRPTVPHED